MNSRLTQAAYCRTRHHGNSILFFPLRPVLYNRPPHFSPPLLPRHVKIAGRPLASREESHASLMRPRPFHRLEPRTWPRHLARVYRAAYGDSIDIGILFNFFSPLSLPLSLHRPPFFRPISLRVSDRFFLRRFLAARVRRREARTLPR